MTLGVLPLSMQYEPRPLQIVSGRFVGRFDRRLPDGCAAGQIFGRA